MFMKKAILPAVVLLTIFECALGTPFMLPTSRDGRSSSTTTAASKVAEVKLPISKKTLPEELLVQLDDDEIVEEIIVREENGPEQIINLKIADEEEAPLGLPLNPEEEQDIIQTFMNTLVEEIGQKELPRNAKVTLSDNDLLEGIAEEDRQSILSKIASFQGQLTNEDLIALLRAHNLDAALPVNRKSQVTDQGLQRFGAEMKEEDLAKLVNGNPTQIQTRQNLPDRGDGADGIRCLPKVMQVEETVYDRAMKCHHSYQEKCHMTYITDYASTTQEKCETTFKKNCHITFKPTPFEEKVSVCHTPFVRECREDIQGPETCTTQYEDNCETRYKSYELEQDEPVCIMENQVRCENVRVQIPSIVPGGEPQTVTREKCEEWPVQKCTLEKKTVKKVHPETSCRKIPREVCIPNNCQMVKGEEICQQESRTQVQNVPEEECDLQPEENCHMEAALVPRLVPKPNCLKVPKEICVNTKKNPRREKKPVIKEWCYNPRELNLNEEGQILGI